MRGEALGKPDTFKREIAIVKHLRNKKDVGATAREIYDAVTAELSDTISRPAYYKILDRLVAAGKIDVLDDEGVRLYSVANQLHATNRLTLDDVYEMLPFYKSSETMARAIEAQQYFIENRDKALKKAAQALTSEPAAELFFRWIDDLMTAAQKDIDMFHAKEEEGMHLGQSVLADAGLEQRIRSEVRTLRDILYRYLSIPFDAVDLPDWEGLHGLKDSNNKIHYDPDKLKGALASKVFGVGKMQTVLGFIKLESDDVTVAKQEMIVSGSDGSFHAGTLGLRTAKNFIEDESFVVTFNNSVAYIRASERIKERRGPKEFMHTAPLTRQTLDDPAYKGMVNAPFMFPNLSEPEYEHMVRTASDVVQMRVDDEVINGKARDVATGEQIMTPRVHIRDGTITPQDRGYNHYCTMNEYGEIVREGIIRSRSILQRVLKARRTPRIYAGAVKSTQIRLYSRLISWYIAQGSKSTLGETIDPTWEVTHANFVSDVDAMTFLLSSLVDSEGTQNGYWVSCVTIREFASLTDFYDTNLGNRSWFDILRTMRQRKIELYNEIPGRANLSYDTQLSEDDLEDDPYLDLLENADFASFYVGHTHGNPPPKIPRYEFLCSLRDISDYKTPEDRQQHVEKVVAEILTALKVCGFTLDREHNFLSRMKLIKYVISVVYRAHDYAKRIGRQLEQQYKSFVIAKLIERRNRPLPDGEPDIHPIGVSDYMRRILNSENPQDEEDIR